MSMYCLFPCDVHNYVIIISIFYVVGMVCFLDSFNANEAQNIAIYRCSVFVVKYILENVIAFFVHEAMIYVVALHRKCINNKLQNKERN